MATYTIQLDASTTIPSVDGMSDSAAPARERVTPAPVRRSRTTNSADHLSERLSPLAVSHVRDWLESGPFDLPRTEATATRARKVLRQHLRHVLEPRTREDHKEIRAMAADIVRQAQAAK